MVAAKNRRLKCTCCGETGNGALNDKAQSRKMGGRRDRPRKLLIEGSSLTYSVGIRGGKIRKMSSKPQA